MSRWPLVLPIVLLATPAWALKPAEHRSLAEAACHAQGLPERFCSRMGQAAYETDYREWTDLSAHAQTPDGSDRCTAADASATRLDLLARTIVYSAQNGDLDTAAEDLGRAIHTLQDECAHHGMTNQQHAYLSLDDTCGGESTSPDVTPEAIACATDRTRRMMAVAAGALAGTDWSPASWLCGDGDDCDQASLPTPGQACDFLAEYKQWNGIDTTWNAAIAGAGLEAAFAAGLRNEAWSTSICDGDPHAIDPSWTAPHVTSDVTCLLIDVGCLGKVDEGGDSSSAADPYGDPPPPSASGGGCNAGAGANGAWLLALLALVTRRGRNKSFRGMSRLRDREHDRSRSRLDM